MKKQFYLLVIILSANAYYSCNCFSLEENLYETYSKSNYLCLGKIIKKIDLTHYEFEIMKSYKGDIFQKIIIESLPIVSCGLGEIKLADVFIIDLRKIKDNTFSVSRCNYNKKNSDLSFKNDTTCLAAFSNKNTYLNLPYFNGQIKSGKRVGQWTEYYYQDTFNISSFSGKYLNDKRDGVWIESNGTKYLYKKGKLIKTL